MARKRYATTVVDPVLHVALPTQVADAVSMLVNGIPVPGIVAREVLTLIDGRREHVGWEIEHFADTTTARLFYSKTK